MLIVADPRDCRLGRRVHARHDQPHAARRAGARAGRGLEARRRGDRGRLPGARVAFAFAWVFATLLLSARSVPLHLFTGRATLRLMLGTILAAAITGALGVGFGLLLRRQTAAIVVALVWLLVGEPLLAIAGVRALRPGPRDRLGGRGRAAGLRTCSVRPRAHSSRSSTPSSRARSGTIAHEAQRRELKANTCSRPPARLNLLGYGPGRAGRPRRARAQPQGHRRPSAAPFADLRHRPQRLRQVEPRLRHDLRRGPAALRREPLRLRPPVPADDGEAGRRLDRRPLPGDLDRPEDHQPQPALDGRHRHRDLRLPAPALRAHRQAALPGLRPPDRRPEPGGDRRPDPAARRRARSSPSTRRSSATARASTRTSSRSSAQKGSRA